MKLWRRTNTLTDSGSRHFSSGPEIKITPQIDILFQFIERFSTQCLSDPMWTAHTYLYWLWSPNLEGHFIDITGLPETAVSSLFLHDHSGHQQSVLAHCGTPHFQLWKYRLENFWMNCCTGAVKLQSVMWSHLWLVQWWWWWADILRTLMSGPSEDGAGG